jgi:ABC-type polysaccharide/polyol phosphate transport system ATPase subunit
VQRGSRRTLRVLDGISFDVQRGELFTVVGRNGSGKTTLLRILGSIYRIDSGSVHVTGSLAPFIELGVGFQPHMSARQNVVLNGVILGLGRREMRRRADQVLAYAELEDFADVQLKKFSSGMRMKLAFSSMLLADPDIYLIDEILSVGDEAFKAKCSEEFATLKGRNKTVVMVTHRPSTVERESDRAMWLRDGKVGRLGNPREVLEAYRSEGLGAGGGRPADDRRAVKRRPTWPRPRAPRATIETLYLTGAEDGTRVAAGEPLRMRIEAQASGWVRGPTLELAITGADGTTILAASDSDLERLPVLRPGDRMTAEVTVGNPLTAGRYRLDCMLRHGADHRTGPASEVRSVDFEIDGDTGGGLVALERTAALDSATKLELVR